MSNLSSKEIRERFLKFFESRGHKIIPSAPLVPENDPSVLFNTAGMQPLTPYLLGEKHPLGNRLVDAQKCVRTNDIDEVGDNTHFTFFEMLGNWSFGDYFKKESLNWSWEFLMDKENGLGLSPERIYVTVFEGNNDSKKDIDAYEIWKDIFERSGLNPDERIFFMDAENNWWSAGDGGPCGPDSEIFYDVTKEGIKIKNKNDFMEADDKQDVIEIWNNVFMEFLKKDGKVVGNLDRQNVDTGAGFERLVSIIQKKDSPYETDLFKDSLGFLEKESGKKYEDYQKDFRIILDHIRTSIFLISDGVIPSNKDQGYILRRLLRRATLKMKNINFPFEKIGGLIENFIKKYHDIYPNVLEEKEKINGEIKDELIKFSQTLEKGMREFEKMINPEVKNNNIYKLDFGVIDASGPALNELTGKDIFLLVTTYGFPVEIIKEEAGKRSLVLDMDGFKELLREHNKKSSTASAGKFKGGLGGDSAKIIAFHTATHLLLAALQKFAGTDIHQRGSNITEERARFDFSHNGKVEKEILDKVEEYVNNAIRVGADMIVEEMDKGEARKNGVEGSFWEKYPEIVKVWTIKDKDGNIYSKELCGGPHVKNTSEIAGFGKFKIKKESSSSAGVRRIKAIFEK